MDLGCMSYNEMGIKCDCVHCIMERKHNFSYKKANLCFILFGICIGLIIYRFVLSDKITIEEPDKKQNTIHESIQTSIKPYEPVVMRLLQRGVGEGNWVIIEYPDGGKRWEHDCRLENNC